MSLKQHNTFSLGRNIICLLCPGRRLDWNRNMQHHLRNEINGNFGGYVLSKYIIKHKYSIYWFINSTETFTVCVADIDSKISVPFRMNSSKLRCVDDTSILGGDCHASCFPLSFSWWGINKIIRNQEPQLSFLFQLHSAKMPWDAEGLSIVGLSWLTCLFFKCGCGRLKCLLIKEPGRCVTVDWYYVVPESVAEQQTFLSFILQEEIK